MTTSYIDLRFNDNAFVHPAFHLTCYTLFCGCLSDASENVFKQKIKENKFVSK